MIKSLLYFVLFLSSILLHSQELDENYFLLGSLNHFMVREYPMRNPLKARYVMTRHQNKIGEIRRIEEVIGKKFHR
jgi:hypothetical protein